MVLQLNYSTPPWSADMAALQQVLFPFKLNKPATRLHVMTAQAHLAFFQRGYGITLSYSHRIWHQPWLFWDRVLAHIIRDRLRSS